MEVRERVGGPQIGKMTIFLDKIIKSFLEVFITANKNLSKLRFSPKLWCVKHYSKFLFNFNLEL